MWKTGGFLASCLYHPLLFFRIYFYFIKYNRLKVGSVVPWREYGILFKGVLDLEPDMLFY